MVNHQNWFNFQNEQNIKAIEWASKCGQTVTQGPYNVGTLPEKFTLSNATYYVKVVFAPSLSDAKIKKMIRENAAQNGKIEFAVNYAKPGASATTGNICQTGRSADFFTRESVEALFS